MRVTLDNVRSAPSPAVGALSDRDGSRWPSRPRVLMISENESVPGDRRVWDIATTLAQGGHEVVVICPQDERDAEPYEVRDGIEIHRYRASFATGAMDYLREYGRALWCTWRLTRRLARKRAFDIVHCCSPPDFLLFAAWPARRRGARLIFDHHDLTPELFRARFGDGHRMAFRLTVWLERVSLRAADVAIATNEAYAEIQVTRAGKRPEDVFIVRNAPDLSRLRPVPLDQSLRRGKPALIGYLGVMCAQDGVDLALQALAVLRERRDDWHAVFAGDGDALPELKAMAERLGIADSVEFAGWIGDEQIATLLSTADICLSPEPKTAFNDVSTLVKVTEYMAMSRAIVAFPLKQTQLLADDAALYAEVDDVASFAARIDELLDNPDQRARMGATGRARVERSLTWEHSKLPLEAAYRRAARSRPAAMEDPPARSAVVDEPGPQS
jgi:glycosyltransferase involved in cell wall biosynthesis